MGRRGGECQRLGIPVQGRWKACSLAIPALSKWEDWDLVMEVNPIAIDALTTYTTVADSTSDSPPIPVGAVDRDSIEVLEACIQAPSDPLNPNS